jgi:hypothetical protein
MTQHFLSKQLGEDSRLLDWMQGNHAAANFLLLAGELSQIADDFVDGDTQDSAKMHRMLHIALVDIPLNPFYQQHSLFLIPVLSTIITQWDLSNRLQNDESEMHRMHAYVLREAADSLVQISAYLVSGSSQWAQVVAEQAQRFYHEEPFEAWDKETKT